MILCVGGSGFLGLLAEHGEAKCRAESTAWFCFPPGIALLTVAFLGLTVWGAGAIVLWLAGRAAGSLRSAART